MIIEYEDDGVIRWEWNGEKKHAELIELIEAYEAEPIKHGRWKKEWSSIFHTELPACSECGRFSALEWNYCPNCGADMRGGENDTK